MQLDCCFYKNWMKVEHGTRGKWNTKYCTALKILSLKPIFSTAVMAKFHFPFVPEDEKFN